MFTRSFKHSKPIFHSLRVLLSILLMQSICTQVYSQTKDLDFFIGTWDFKVWFNNNTSTSPDITAQWRLERGLDSTLCLLGNVKINGQNFTREMIVTTLDKKEYVRSIIANDGSYITLTSAGWKEGLLTWVGTQVTKEQKTELKEEVTKLNNNSFKAIFYRLIDGEWVQTQTELLERINTAHNK